METPVVPQTSRAARSDDLRRPVIGGEAGFRARCSRGSPESEIGRSWYRQTPLVEPRRSVVANPAVAEAAAAPGVVIHRRRWIRAQTPPPRAFERP